MGALGLGTVGALGGEMLREFIGDNIYNYAYGKGIADNKIHLINDVTDAYKESLGKAARVTGEKMIKALFPRR